METRAVLLVAVGGEVQGSVASALAELSLSSEAVQDVKIAVDHLASRDLDIAAIIYGFPEAEQNGTDCIGTLRRMAPDIPIIVTSAAGTTAIIVAALKNGAADFVCQPATGGDWRKAILQALRSESLNELPAPAGPVVAGVFVGRSPGMSAIAATLAQVAWSEAPVLIQGETGCGKEVLARAVHAESQRAKKPFVKLNCAALPSELVESELFGYERGAFTGAFQRKPGMFEAADGGTILLDEIGDMDVRLQAKLLQVLQDHAFQRIGGKELINVDVRVLAATHRDLEKSIADGSFREDLYYRLNVVNIVVPPLRERKEDLFELTELLLNKYAKPGGEAPSLTPGLREAMLAWHWPGNVRELENCVRKLLIFRDCTYAERELRERLRRHGSQGGAPQRRAEGQVETFAETAEPQGEPEDLRIPVMSEVNRLSQRAEADAILSALNAAHWNRRSAALLLNVDYKSLLYRMKKLGLDQQRAPRPMSDPVTPSPAGVERKTSDCREPRAAAGAGAS